MKNYKDVFSLKGKNVFVLGGLGLLGIAISKAVAALGARVVIMDINEHKSKSILTWAKKNKHRLFFEYFDATDLNAAENSLKRLIKSHGPMHVFINVSYPRTPDWGQTLDKMTPAYLKANVDLHMNSYVWISRIAAFLMQKDKVDGSIINFGSIYGVVANDLTIYEGTEMSGEGAYCAIKGGIINFTRFLASYFGKYNIRANCICPGGILEKFHNPIFVKNYENKVPLKRMGTVEDIANAVIFLASEASSYVTGATLMVDGGWTAI